ncbi:MAG: acyltransferase [Solirubrobacteraceae bacterium]
MQRARRRLKGKVMNTLAPIYMLPDEQRLRLLRAGGVVIGAGTVVKSGGTFEGAGNISIGEGCFIGAQTFLEASFASVTIGDRVYIAHRANVLTATHAVGSREQRASLPQQRRPVEIGSGCWIGTGATVLPGVTIGEGCVIAAGAVVCSDCSSDGLYAGVPARRIRDL